VGKEISAISNVFLTSRPNHMLGNTLKEKIMKKLPILLIGFVLLLNSCKDQSSQNDILVIPPVYHDLAARIEGKWFWLESTGGPDGTILSPTSVNQNTVYFSKDSNYSFYRNNNIEMSSEYTIRKGKSIYLSDSLDFIYYLNPINTNDVILKLTKDSLMLQDTLPFGFRRVYIKIGL
jgi:hypothetical protein